MTARQIPNKKRWTFTLPAVFAAMLIAFSAMNARFMPLAGIGAAQNSRRTAWEDGVPSPGYAKALHKTQELESKLLRGRDDVSNANHPFLKSTSGQGWKMWDRESILHDNMNLTCNWNDYRPFIGRSETAPAVPFCAHPLSDDQFVSNNIVKKGRHVECDGLPKMLEKSVDPNNNDQPVIYIDVGANIGTCVMQMLLTTDATIMAFEPHPFNLFVMTSTFMGFEKKYRDRIHLFPIALGAESSDSTIHMASDNRGHAVVSKVIRINKKATFLPPMPIRVEPLDSILKDSTKVHLMKMDAQGFECYIFEGMKRVLHRTKTVFFELEKKVLNGFERCSPQLLWDKFMQIGFEMHLRGMDRPATKELPDKGKINIIAMQ